MTVSSQYVAINYNREFALSPALTATFDRNSYRVVEGGNVSVCVILVGEADSPVEVSLFTLPGNATGSNLKKL